MGLSSIFSITPRRKGIEEECTPIGPFHDLNVLCSSGLPRPLPQDLPQDLPQHLLRASTCQAGYSTSGMSEQVPILQTSNSTVPCSSGLPRSLSKAKLPLEVSPQHLPQNPPRENASTAIGRWKRIREALEARYLEDMVKKARLSRASGEDLPRVQKVYPYEEESTNPSSNPGIDESEQLPSALHSIGFPRTTLRPRSPPPPYSP